MLQSMPKIIGGPPVECRPQNCSGGVAEEESRPAHAIDASQKDRQGTEQGDKSAEEDDLAAMPAEEILAELDPGIGELQIVTITQEQTVADFPADRVADIVAEDRPNRSRGNHQPDIKLLCRAGVNCGRDQSRFAGQGQSHALESDDAPTTQYP